MNVNIIFDVEEDINEIGGLAWKISLELANGSRGPIIAQNRGILRNSYPQQNGNELYHDVFIEKQSPSKLLGYVVTHYTAEINSGLHLS